MKKVIVLSALLLVTGMSVYAQEDFSKSIKTTTTIVENADKYKVNAARKSKVDDNTARMQSIKQLGV
ncbi:hypothetical protein NXV10_25920 [Bacteroides thetaiotaomicron]|nr:hypothetical protein [Bacteroides thetaiotaomicron]